MILVATEEDSAACKYRNGPASAASQFIQAEAASRLGLIQALAGRYAVIESELADGE